MDRPQGVDIDVITHHIILHFLSIILVGCHELLVFLLDFFGEVRRGLLPSVSGVPPVVGELLYFVLEFQLIALFEVPVLGVFELNFYLRICVIFVAGGNAGGGSGSVW